MKNKFILSRDNPSGTFSARSTYVPQEDGKTVKVEDWVHDSYGIIPSGTETRVLTLEQARAEYRERRANDWKVGW